MPPTVAFQIKPEWKGEEAAAKARALTKELEKQKAAVGWAKNLEYGFHNLGLAIVKNQAKVKEWRQAFGDVFAQIGADRQKKWDEFFARNETGMDRLIKKSKDLRQDFGVAFEMSTARGVGFTLNKITGGIDTAIGKIFNLKNALLATAVGGGIFTLGRKALGNARDDARIDARVRREFQGPLGQNIRDAADIIAPGAGIQNGDALAALTPIGRAIKETVVGSKLRSGQALKTQAQVDLVRKQTLGLATKYTNRVLTLFPESSPEEVGRMLAEAGTGEEGFRQLARFVGLGRASTNDIVKEAQKKKLPIGDIVGKILERGGITEQAASDQRKTFDFQIKSIGSQLEDAIGNVGSSAIERLNKSLGEGTTLAEKLQKYLASPEGKKMIDSLGDALSRVVGFAADLAKKIPETIRFISDHKTLLLSIAGAYGALKVGGGVANAIGGIKSAGGIGAAFGGGIRGSTPATPLYVSQVGGGGLSVPGGGSLPSKLQKGGAVLGALTFGYEFGTLIDKQFGLSDKISHISDAKNKAAEDKASETYREILKIRAQRREVQVQGLMDQGYSRGQAIYMADHPNAPALQPANVSVTVKVGERELAAAVHAETQRQRTNEARNQAGR